jgi:hypothetical protein
VIVYVPVTDAIVLPVALAPSKVVKLKLSDPGGTSGPLTVHGQLPGVIELVTVVVRPPGGALPFTVLSVILTETDPLPRYCGERERELALAFCGVLTAKDVGTSVCGVFATVPVAPEGAADVPPVPPPPQAANARMLSTIAGRKFMITDPFGATN